MPLTPNHLPESPQSQPCLALGLGGLGLKALKSFKENTTHTFAPTSQIRFLGIDSHEGEATTGNAALLGDEFLHLRDIAFSSLLHAPMGRQMLSHDPRYTWMSLDYFARLPYTDGTGAIRQLGRALFISRAGEIRDRIARALVEVTRAGGSDSVEVFIFTGLTGGTGSGAFLDLSYIVRQTLADLGLTARATVRGFFFLPDTVDAVLTSASDRHYNRSNGFAALTELDRLMKPARSRKDHFRQDYGSFAVDTPAPPVDICYLISEMQTDGSRPFDGLTGCLRTAADFALTQIIDSNSESPFENENPSPHHEPGCVYCAFGTAVAEIPRQEIAGYLAAGFMDRFQEMVGEDRPDKTPTPDQVIHFAKAIGLTKNDVLATVMSLTKSPDLKEIGWSELFNNVPMVMGKLPPAWEATINRILYENRQQCERKCRLLSAGCNGDVTAYVREAVDGSSYAARIFARLCSVSCDQEWGPYYAHKLLFNKSYDLRTCVDSIILEMHAELASLEKRLESNDSSGLMYEIAKASTGFVKPSLLTKFTGINEERYKHYKEAVEAWSYAINRKQVLEYASKAMKAIRNELDFISRAYFVPLIEMLDTLTETTNANRTFFAQSMRNMTSSDSIQILELDDIRQDLDSALENIESDRLVAYFMGKVCQEYETWIGAEQARTVAFFSQFIADTFGQDFDLDLETCLRRKYSSAYERGNLPTAVAENVIRPLYEVSKPFFWCDSSAVYTEKDKFEESTFVLVPESSKSLLMAAEESQYPSPLKVFIRETSLKDRIYMTRVIPSISLRDYGGLSQLKLAYDNNRDELVRAGLNLFPDADESGEDLEDEKY